MYFEEFEEDFTKLIDESNMSMNYWILEFKNLYKKVFHKLDSCIKEHQLWAFLKAVRIFNPSQTKSISKDLIY